MGDAHDLGRCVDRAPILPENRGSRAPDLRTG
jgi:hypothetical protein